METRVKVRSSKTICVMVLSMLSVSALKCQPSSRLLEEKHISYKIFQQGFEIEDSIVVKESKAIIQTKFSPQARRNFLSFPSEKWFTYLSDTLTDWGANLVLYDLYKKDAIIFKSIKTKTQWRECCREVDITYWREFFKKDGLQ